MAVNPNLAKAFSPVFNLIDFWLWGHEHDLCIFEPYSMGPGQPLPTCRCVGASAVPMFPGTALSNNGTVFNHAYAIVTLENATLSINYYQFDSTEATPGDPPAPTALAYSDKAVGHAPQNP